MKYQILIIDKKHIKVDLNNPNENECDCANV